MEDDSAGSCDIGLGRFRCASAGRGRPLLRELPSVKITEGPISPVSPGVRPYALDPEHAKALWAKSEDMVGERF